MEFSSEPIRYRDTGKFGALFCDYADNRPELRNFHSGFPEKEAFSRLISARESQFSTEQRQLLCHSLEKGILHPQQQRNLERLRQAHCFTVSCGHQLSIGGGPQYMAFKILTTIRLADDLSAMFPEKQFVPVFWLAGEDHDLEEILSLRFFQQAYRIEKQGSGAVGRLLCGDIGAQLESIRDFPADMAAAYQPEITLSAASRNWLNYRNSLFSAAHVLLKRLCQPTLKLNYISSRKTSKWLVRTCLDVVCSKLLQVNSLLLI